MEISNFMTVLLACPWLGFVVSAVFCLLWSRRHGKVVALAVVSWALYALYECLMQAGVFRCGDCNIRIDLLVVYPVLFFVSLAAAIQAIGSSIRKPARSP